MRATYVTSDGVRLNVAVAGPEGAPTVVLVHGLTVRGAVLGATPTAVLRWTDADDAPRASAVAAPAFSGAMIELGRS